MTINSNQEMVILRGLQGSGKSTFAHAWVAEDPDWRFRVNRDDLRKAGFNMYWGLSHHMEGTISLVEEAVAKAALNAGLSVIIDATNLRARSVRDWYKVADAAGVSVRVHDIDVPLEQCIENDVKREKKVGEEVIRSFSDRYLNKGKFPPVPEHLASEPEGRAYTPNPALPKAVWLDLDGTVADRDHPNAPQPVRGPFDEARVGEDAVIEHVADIVRALSSCGYSIVGMSGRSDACWDESAQWLRDNNIPFDDLFMRKSGDLRKDNIVKHDLFWEFVAPKYDVKFALDDRNQVVEFTRNVLKIPVLQVAEGNF